jgi:hypothetical protein
MDDKVRRVLGEKRGTDSLALSREPAGILIVTLFLSWGHDAEISRRLSGGGGASRIQDFSLRLS